MSEPARATSKRPVKRGRESESKKNASRKDTHAKKPKKPKRKKNKDSPSAAGAAAETKVASRNNRRVPSPSSSSSSIVVVGDPYKRIRGRLRQAALYVGCDSKDDTIIQLAISRATPAVDIQSDEFRSMNKAAQGRMIMACVHQYGASLLHITPVEFEDYLSRNVKADIGPRALIEWIKGGGTASDLTSLPTDSDTAELAHTRFLNNNPRARAVFKCTLILRYAILRAEYISDNPDEADSLDDL